MGEGSRARVDAAEGNAAEGNEAEERKAEGVKAEGKGAEMIGFGGKAAAGGDERVTESCATFSDSPPVSV